MPDSPKNKRHPLLEFVGWIPAIIIPTATVMALIKVFHAENVSGVDPWTWLLFGVANFCFYVYTEKYRSPQAILGFLGTALLDFVIVAVVLIRSAA